MTIRLFMLQPEIVFAARCNNAGRIYPVDGVDFDTVTTGAYTDILPGMTVLFGSTAGADDHGRQRIRKAATSSRIYFGRSSAGFFDGEVAFTDGSYITVLDDFRVWNKPPVFVNDDNDTTYKDADIAVGDYGSEPPPVANCGPGCGATIDSGTSVITVAFDGRNSFPVADGASIASFAWDVGDGTITIGTINADHITATFPAGFRWVSLTVTDDNGKTHTARCPVYARDPDADNTIACQIVSHELAIQGQRVSVRILEDIPESTYPDGTLMMLMDGEPSTAADRGHMLIIGWHDADAATMSAQRNGTLRNTTLDIIDVAGRMAQIRAYSLVIQNEAYRDTSKYPSTTWQFMATPNVDRFLHYVLHWHSTALELADWTDTGIGDDYPFHIKAAQGQQLAAQVDAICKSIRPDYMLGCNRYGQLAAIVDHGIQIGNERPSPYVSLGADDIADVRWPVRRTPRVYELLAGAVVASNANNDAVIFCRAPGDAPGSGAERMEVNGALVRSQQMFNFAEGYRYARVNARYGRFPIRLVGGSDFGIDPGNGGLVAVTLPAGVAAQRGLTLAAASGIVHSMRIEYGSGRSAGVRTATLDWEYLTSGPPAVTYIPPETTKTPDDGSLWSGDYADTNAGNTTTTPKWLAGDIPASAIVGAYEPWAALDLGSSYINLANPGTYDCTVPVNAPDLNDGWEFVGTFAGHEYLDTGITPGTDWTMIVGFRAVTGTSETAAGLADDADTRFHVTPSSGGNRVYGFGQDVSVSGNVTEGVMGIANHQGYLNGTADGGTSGAWSGAPSNSIYVGALNVGGGDSNNFGGIVTHVYIYNTTLTADQIAAVSAKIAQDVNL